MSDLSILSHVYAEWNTNLGKLNSWLLEIKKMKDGYSRSQDYVEIPIELRKFLKDIADTLDPSSTRPTSAIPLSIKQKLLFRLKNQAEDTSHRINELLEMPSFHLDTFNKEDIQLFITIVVSLDDEVTSIYNRMRRNR